MVEAASQPMDHGRFERVVVQDGRIDEGRELRLATHDILGLAADPRPDRIDLIERRLCLMLRHGLSPENDGDLLSYWAAGRPKTKGPRFIEPLAE